MTDTVVVLFSRPGTLPGPRGTPPCQGQRSIPQRSHTQYACRVIPISAMESQHSDAPPFPLRPTRSIWHSLGRVCWAKAALVSPGVLCPLPSTYAQIDSIVDTDL